MTRQTPEVGPVIDVEHHLAAGGSGDLDRLALGGRGVGGRKMGARDDHGGG